MRSTEELRNTLVLLRPDNIPELHNKIGEICSDLMNEDTVIVGFGNDAFISFSIHELFILRDSEEIEKSAGLDRGLLPSWNYGDIMQVAMFARSQNKTERMVAIEMSRKDPDIFEYTMSSLAEELGFNKQRQISR